MKKIISFILVISILFSLITISFADTYEYNKDKTETYYRMQNILNKYNKITQSAIQNEINKYYDIKDHWGQEYIARLSIIEVIVGDGKGQFNPNDILLACQYIKMIVVALGFTPEKGHGIDWWKPFVDIALKEQIINPGEINDYTKPLSRELAAVIGFRALMKFEEYPYEQWYNYNKAKMDDYNLINDKYKQEVVMACRKGLIIGDGKGKFDPKGNLTRAQAAVIVNKLIDKNLRTESVPQPDEVITYKRRTEINEALFNYLIEPGKETKIYLGDLPLNEMFYVFKAMMDNINLGSGYKELTFESIDVNIAVSQFYSKSDADYFYNFDNRYPKDYARFGILMFRYYKEDLTDNSSGYLYKLDVFDNESYNKQMKDYMYKILEVLFEKDYQEVKRLHDYYLNLCLTKKEYIGINVHYLNNRQITFRGTGSTFEIFIWGKNFISKDNIFKVN